jgi:hypothetical protein
MDPAKRFASRVAAATCAAIFFALFVCGGGCELVVGDSVPDYNCLPSADNACPIGFSCDSNTRKCVATEGTCHPTCPGSMRCDPATLRCKAFVDAAVVDARRPDSSPAHPDANTDARGDAPGDAPEDAVGESLADGQPESTMACRGLACDCAGASFCDSGVCGTESEVTTPVFSANNSSNFCTQPCCRSEDCSPSTVCFAAGTGGNYCVPPAWLGRSTILGTGIGGAKCTGSSGCRSGVCSSGACADTCCSSADKSGQCATGTICRYSTFPGNGTDTHYTAWCSPQGAGTIAGGSNCPIDGACVSNRCTATICEAACRNSADCGNGLACSYTPGPLNSKDFAAGCVYANGQRAEGGACTNNNDCVTDFCDLNPSTPSMGRCSDVCFADSDCTVPGWRCRPARYQYSTGVTLYILSCGS